MALEEPRCDASRRLEANLARCRQVIAAAARRAGREPSDVSLLAVTKYAAPEMIRLLHALGVRDFGENTVQGAEEKMAALGGLEGASWHMIGHLQRNKVSKALQLFETIQSLDSERLALEISMQAARRSLPVPELYVELNLAGESRKTGLPEEQTRSVLASLREESLLAPRVRGLMTMAPHGEDPESSRPVFRRLRQIRDELVRDALLPKHAGLSMGMSGDLAVAVEEGATVVRIGSMLFESLE